MARPPAKPTSRSAPYESPRFHPPRQQARRRARQARPRRNRRRHRPQEPRPRQSVRPPRSHRRRCPQRCRRALPRQIRGRPQMRWPDERRDRSARRTRPKGRAPSLHVLVLAEALPRRHHHRRDQTAPRMRRRKTRRSRKERRRSSPFSVGPRYRLQMSPPKWIKPQLCKFAAKAPSGPLWIHEIKFDGYRIAARIDQGAVQLLTRSGLDWTAKYPATTAALAKLKFDSAYLDGELCGVRPDGVTSFELMQQATDRGGAGLVYFVFDLLDLDGESLAALPLLDRKTRLAALLEKSPNGIAFSAHESCDGEAFRRAACEHGLEGVVSKRVDRRYLPDDRSAWIKTKCLNRG